MNCELCGQKKAVYECEVEGTIMQVCVDCSRFGNIKKKKNIKIIFEEKKGETKKEEAEPIYEIKYALLNGYGAIVKRAREKLGLKQEEMAKRLNIRASLLHQIESEHLRPSIDIAKKLEKELKISILEEKNSSSISVLGNADKYYNNEKYSGKTLGDFIKRK